jgi:hypothetical protein
MCTSRCILCVGTREAFEVMSENVNKTGPGI